MAEVEKGPLDKLIEWLLGWKASFDQLRTQFGVPVAVLLIFCLAGGVIWWNWEEIAKRPGIERGVEFLDRQPLPTAPMGRVAIAVAHLDKDKDREHEELLIDELRTLESDSAEVERVDPQSSGRTHKRKVLRKQKLKRKRGPCSRRLAQTC